MWKLISRCGIWRYHYTDKGIDDILPCTSELCKSQSGFRPKSLILTSLWKKLVIRFIIKWKLAKTVNEYSAFSVSITFFFYKLNLRIVKTIYSFFKSRCDKFVNMHLWSKGVLLGEWISRSIDSTSCQAKTVLFFSASRSISLTVMTYT